MRNVFVAALARLKMGAVPRSIAFSKELEEQLKMSAIAGERSVADEIRLRLTHSLSIAPTLKVKVIFET